ncbi:MAG TPA: glycerate kinase, partial [Bacteroidota bacterium]|nr:glycerate kinase [Bacteroidota bacterium]
MTSHSRPELPASSGRRVLLPPVARVLICPASFKGSLSAAEAAEAMALGVSDTLPHASIDVLPLSDGGEGLVSVLAPALRAGIRTSTVQGPLASQRVDAQWAMTADRSTAV